VESSKDRDDAFLLTFENGFLDGLDDEELIAVVAHELGHVWIFTHHPYLQTEQLANEIAMRVVSRESLRRVYEKVWERGGTKGDLARFLGN
jgi:predicted Zn-dependent protease